MYCYLRYRRRSRYTNVDITKWEERLMTKAIELDTDLCATKIYENLNKSIRRYVQFDRQDYQHEDQLIQQATDY